MGSKADHNPHANWDWWKCTFYAITLAVYGWKQPSFGHFLAIFGLFCQIFCSSDHIYVYFRLELHQCHTYTCGKVVWGRLAPLQVPFQVRGCPKMPFFRVKMDHDGRLVPGQGNPPGSCLMGHITSQSMGKHDLGPFMPSPATYLVQWPRGSENGYFWAKK